jgi:uncharacterized protein (TIGR02679 family)
MNIDPRLHKLLGGEALAPLRQRLRRYFARMEPDAQPGMLRLGKLNAPEREALALLTGRPPRQAKSIQIDIASLDAAMRNAGVADSLYDALAQLDGPIEHPASARAEAQARWSVIATTCRNAGLAAYLKAPAAFGLLKRLARQDHAVASRLIERAEAVLYRLPAMGLPRAQLAAETLGNAHALDDGQATATLVLAVWRQLQDEGEVEKTGSGDADDDPDNARGERTREIWARAGVLVNELARPALYLNLPVQSSGAGLWTPSGEPGYLSLRRLVRAPPVWRVAGRTVFICENPNLIAIAADRLGSRCAPFVCTEGMPAAAQRTLLLQLAQAGACLRYHGDFDWPGVRIANHVMRACAARPWRFEAGDYENAAARAPHTQRDLHGTCIAASWDGALAPAMQRHGLAIAEEAVAESLLKDLQQA